MIFIWIIQLMVEIGQIRGNFIHRLSIIENTAYPNSLVNVEQILRENKMIPLDTNNKLKIYSLEEKGSSFSLIDNKLYIHGNIDRETVCPDLKSSQNYELSMEAPNKRQTRNSCKLDECCTVFSFQVDLGYMINSYYILVNIIDQNDNIPKFLSFSNPYISLLENSPISTICALPLAIDLDSDNFGIKRYVIVKPFIIGNDSHFSLMDKMISGRPYLILTASLDREVTPEYRFLLRAIDRDFDDSKESTGVEVEIKVLDINDNAPAFDKTFYTTSITEHSKLMNIISFYITDPDEGPNKQVSITIETENEMIKNQIKNFFQVDFSMPTMTGSIKLIDEIDYESHLNKYSFNLVAKDNGRPSLSSTSNVVIIIINKNDHAPVIKVIRKGELVSRSISIYENEPAKTIIASLQVSDQDSPVTDIECSINDYTLNFEITPLNEIHPLGHYKEFIISSLKILDREDENNQYLNIKIHCSDQDKLSPLSTNFTILINLQDINDNPPIFTRSKYQGELMENIPQGIVKMIEAIQTTDKDQGKNAQVIFKMDTTKNSSDWQYFTLDSNTGKLFSKISIDYEKNKQFSFYIIALDKDQPNLSSSALVIVHIIDANDNTPIFTKPHYSFNVRENVPINTFIGQIESTDLDTKSENKFVKYYPKTYNTNHQVIHVDQNTGKIRTIGPIDREKIKTLSILITARNEANYQNSNLMDAECMVVITIDDENDNPPVFALINPSKPSISFFINKNGKQENCQQIPYAVSDADHEESNSDECCTLQLDNDYNGVLYLISSMPNFLCLQNSVNIPATYRVSLIATDSKNNPTKRLKAKVSFSVFVKNEIVENHVVEKSENKVSVNKNQYSSYHSVFSLIIIIIVVVIVCVLIITFVLLVFYKYLAFNAEDTSSRYDKNADNMLVQSTNNNNAQMKFCPNNSQQNIYLSEDLKLFSKFNSEGKDNSLWSKTLKKNEWNTDKTICPNQNQDAYQLINSSDHVSSRSPNIGYEALCLGNSNGHEYFSVGGKELHSANMTPCVSKTFDNTIGSSFQNYQDNDMKYCQTSFV